MDLFLPEIFLSDQTLWRDFILQGNKNIEAIVKKRRREEVGKW
jgi:hypothetical protein